MVIVGEPGTRVVLESVVASEGLVTPAIGAWPTLHRPRPLRDPCLAGAGAPRQRAVERFRAVLAPQCGPDAGCLVRGHVLAVLSDWGATASSVTGGVLGRRPQPLQAPAPASTGAPMSCTPSGQGSQPLARVVNGPPLSWVSLVRRGPRRARHSKKRDVPAVARTTSKGHVQSMRRNASPALVSGGGGSTGRLGGSTPFALPLPHRDGGRAAEHRPGLGRSAARPQPARSRRSFHRDHCPWMAPERPTDRGWRQQLRRSAADRMPEHSRRRAGAVAARDTLVDLRETSGASAVIGPRLG